MRYCKYVKCMFDNAKDKEARAGDISVLPGTPRRMSPHQVWSAFLALFISCSLASDGFPTGACSVQDQACEIHEYNLVASSPGVASVEECRQLCSDDQQHGLQVLHLPQRIRSKLPSAVLPPHTLGGTLQDLQSLQHGNCQLHSGHRLWVLE